MQQMVNFLPWRYNRRRRSARRWGLVFITTLVAIAFVGLLAQSRAAGNLRHAMLWQQADEALLAALAEAEQPLRLTHQQRQQAEARIVRRQNTLAWRQALLALAERLPGQAWLTLLRWQQNQLELSGVAGTFDALSELEKQLRGMVGFRLQQTGATLRDAQGRWQFHYQLYREPDDGL